MTPRIAALYDIHGNLPALDAVLGVVESAGVESIVVGGDVLLGPMPMECLARLRALGDRATFIRGNCDRIVVDAFDGRASDKLPDAVEAAVRWTVASLDRSARDFVAGWPMIATMEVTSIGSVAFCHATPRNDAEVFTAQSPDHDVAAMFRGLCTDVAVCGHTHAQFDRRVGDMRIVNPGSVGMPFGQSGAFWLLIGDDIGLQRTEYDRHAAAAVLGRSTYPDVKGFIRSFVMS